MYQLYCADTNDDDGWDNELNVPRMTNRARCEFPNEIKTQLSPFFLSLASITGDVDLKCII